MYFLLRGILQMKKAEFLQHECVVVKALSKTLTEKSYLFEFTASNLQFGRQLPNGKFKLMNEEELAMDYLENGKGVVYKGFVYFKENKTAENKHFENFQRHYNRLVQASNRKKEGEHDSYMNGVMYESLTEASHFGMVKSIISLYQTGLFSAEILESKLNKYVHADYLQAVLQEVCQSVKKAG